MFHTVTNVLVGAQQPCVNAIFGRVIIYIGYKIRVRITDWFKIQFKVLKNIVEHFNIIVMNNEDVVDIAQDVGVVSIAINVNFGIDKHVWVRWAWVVPPWYHTVRQVLAERLSITLQAIESTDYYGFITNISTPLLSKDGPDRFGNGCSHVGINNITLFNLMVIQSRNS